MVIFTVLPENKLLIFVRISSMNTSKGNFVSLASDYEFTYFLIYNKHVLDLRYFLSEIGEDLRHSLLTIIIRLTNLLPINVIIKYKNRQKEQNTKKDLFNGI